MGCGEFLVKYILFFTNLVFALAGLALLGLGVAAQLQVATIADLTDQSLSLAPISSMVVGGIVFLIAFFGCCGAIRESNCMLVTYSICMLVLMIAKIALAVLIFTKLDDVITEVPKWLNEAFSNNPRGFQELEKAFHCCGPNGAQSYILPDIPSSCCAAAPCTLMNSYTGCNSVLEDFFRTFGLSIGVVAIVVASIELVSVVFGLCLANHVKNKYRRSRY